MSHLTVSKNYKRLSERINQFPQGAPASDLLFQILKMLFDEKEAGLVALLPIRPFKVKKAAKVWKKSEKETQKILNSLADKGVLLDLGGDKEVHYILPPPMAGFFEFSLMRIQKNINQKLLSELFYEYMNVEEDFIKALFINGQTHLGRVFVNEEVLTDNTLHVLDYEKASGVIKNSEHMAVGICYCRHKMEHIGKACNAPMDICMTFGNTALSLINHKIARKVSKEEGVYLLQKAYDNNLVQFGENVKNGVNFICNCCGCCCEAMLAAKRFALLSPVHTTNFLPQIDQDSCKGCGICAKVCPIDAIKLNNHTKKVHLNKNICLGCGLCAKNCPSKNIKLVLRKEKVITPVNSAHRVVMMAIERGKLQNLIFDNQALYSHRAMAAILGVILKAPGIKQGLASKQLKSRYLEYLFKK